MPTGDESDSDEKGAGHITVKVVVGDIGERPSARTWVRSGIALEGCRLFRCLLRPSVRLPSQERPSSRWHDAVPLYVPTVQGHEKRWGQAVNREGRPDGDGDMHMAEGVFDLCRRREPGSMEVLSHGVVWLSR